MSEEKLRITFVLRLIIGKGLRLHIMNVQQYAVTPLLNTGLTIFKALNVLIIFRYCKSLRNEYYF